MSEYSLALYYNPQFQRFEQVNTTLNTFKCSKWVCIRYQVSSFSSGTLNCKSFENYMHRWILIDIQRHILRIYITQYVHKNAPTYFIVPLSELIFSC